MPVRVRRVLQRSVDHLGAAARARAETLGLPVFALALSLPLPLPLPLPLSFLLTLPLLLLAAGAPHALWRWQADGQRGLHGMSGRGMEFGDHSGVSVVE